MAESNGAASVFASSDRPINLVHPSRMTLCDRSLEREVLQLFDRQTGSLMTRMRQIAPARLAAVAQILKGWAHGIGAWQVARAAEAAEFAAGNASAADLRRAIDGLGRAGRRSPGRNCRAVLAK